MKLLQEVKTASSIIVTGAAGGMGRTCCQYLAELGWSVLAIDHNQVRLSQLQHANIKTLAIDLADDDLIPKTQQALHDLSPVWGLINLAGISKGSDVEHLDLEDWQRSFDVNVTPALKLIQLLTPIMKQNGGGSIVNVSSPVGYIGARKPSYAASKAALHGLTMSCARNLGQYNIRVNLLLPGTTITEMTKDWSIERQAAIAEESLLKRLCTPQEIAESLAFLLSEHSRYMTGSILDLTCGSMWGH
ncbi:SDR family oxidoreductase [Acinetobacter sichuanensis]|uniref:SDR family NAD(P)-dependent oxidoreductase n=1 Tax=Acinetobacter sichuanensis TaxID=2136183 RepID=UPI00280E1348|nr:SDR family oxidoreductase [Acinetobacter sichuanensis]MDQ9021821.1 SDR family oxidoreductase [Acinetobacter sichuanensis]